MAVKVLRVRRRSGRACDAATAALMREAVIGAALLKDAAARERTVNTLGADTSFPPVRAALVPRRARRADHARRRCS